MKMQRLIGGARASTRSIFNIALVGALLTFTGHAFGQANEKSGYCEWPADWRTETLNLQGYDSASDEVTADDTGLNDLDAVDKNVIRFNGAVGPVAGEGLLTTLTFPAPLCDWNDDGEIDTATDSAVTGSDAEARPATFFSETMKCGTAGSEVAIALSGNVFGTSTTATVLYTEPENGQILLTSSTTAATAPVSCILELDWVGSNDDDGPLEYKFQVAIAPDPFEAPTLVRALAESYNSAYVEWTLETGEDTTYVATPTAPARSDATHDDPTSYVISWETSTMGARSGSMTVAADANPATDGVDQDDTKRQGARITGLVPEAEYTITVAGRSGTGATTNIGRASAAATSGIAGDPAAAIATVTTQKRYNNPTGPADNTFELSTGESVELDPQDYLLNLALHGREVMNIADTETTYHEYVRGTADEPVVVTYAITSNVFVESLYLSTDPNSQTDDLVRLKGLKEGTSNLTLMATIGTQTFSASMTVKVLENHAPIFNVTEANVIWHIDKEDAGGGTHTLFEIDLMEEFVTGGAFDDEDQGDCGDDDESNVINCDEELTFSISSISGATGYTSPSSYFEITEDNEHDGLITTKAANPEITDNGTAAFVNALERLDDGDEIGMTVTVEDASGGKDTLNIIVEVSTEGNFPPELAFRAVTSNWLVPLSESKGGGSRKISLGSRFSDPDGDDMCFEIVEATRIEGKTVGEDTDAVEEMWAKAELDRQAGQADSCRGSTLTFTMNLPSTDPEDDNFTLLGKYGVETASVQVRAYDLNGPTTSATTRKQTSLPVTVSIRLVYGTNSGPNIRAVAETGHAGNGTFLASGAHEIDEGQSISLTFIADDAQPTGDLLCWTAGRNCTPCKGDEPMSATRAPTGSTFSFFRPPWDSITNKSSSDSVEGSAHTYRLTVTGRYFTGLGSGRRETVRTDYERNNGVYTINLCAADLSGETDTLSFDVKIKDVKEAPVFSAPTATNDFDIFMLIGDYSQSVKARATDGDGDSVTYGAAFVGGCSAAKLETDSETGEITITPSDNEISDDSGKMTCEVEVSASDGDHDVYSVADHFVVTIKNDNSSPSFASGLSAVTYFHPENTRGQVGGNIRVTDADDGDVVSVELSPSTNFSARTSTVRDTDEDSDTYNDIIGYDVIVSVKTLAAMDFEADVNSFDLTLVVSDEYGGANDINVRIDLTDVNEKPTLVQDDEGEDVEIEDQTILVGVEKCVASASDIFEDPDHRDQQAGLYIEASTTRPGDASISIKDNEHICITGHNVGSGPGRVKVTATDREGESVSTAFRVSVEANMAPTVVGDGIPDQEVQEHGRSTDIDLTAHFDDGDIAYEEYLSYSFKVERASIATAVLIDGHYLRIYGDSKGTTEVTVTATDQNDSSVDHTFEVEVIRNDPPVANADAFDDVEQYIGREYDPIDARDAFTDEGDALTYYASTKNSDVATAAIKYDEEGGAWVALFLHSPGTTSVTVTVYDTANNEATNSFDLTVLARNDAPMLANAIEDVEVEMGASHDISMEDVFEDEGSLDYDVSNEDENIADVFYRASENEIRVYGNNTGTTTVVVVATDNIGQTASDTFDVTVVEPPPTEPTNSAPILSGTLDDQTVTAGEPIEVSIEGIFTDPDGDELTYTAESDDTNVATLDLSGLDLTINGVNAGTTIFKITATDGEFNVVGEFDVVVETIPVAVDSIPNQSLAIGGEGLGLNVSDYFFDQDGDVLSYTIETTGNAATVNLTDADIAMSPFTRGSTSVTVTASDPKGRSATQSFSIAVGDDELRNVGQDSLAGSARAILSGTGSAIGSRVETSRSDTGPGFSFGIFNRFMPDGTATTDNSALKQREAIMGFNAKKDLLDSTWNANSSREVDFNFKLPSLDSLLANNFSRTLNGNGGIGSWSIWGTVDAQNFEGLGYEGSANSMFLGLDVQSNECWLFGVTVARNSSESDYSWGTATQTLETNLTTILPYFSYEPVDGKTSVWGVVGRGSGDADTTVVNATDQSSDLSLNMGMFGGRREFAKAGSLQLAFRGDVAFANLETGEGNGAIDELAAGVNRVRAGIEGSFAVDTGNGGKVTPFGELAFRNDGGDGLTGNGVEVAGGVRIDTNSLTIEARGRFLATHSADDFSESGVSLMLNFNPSNDENGLSFSLSPQWGTSADSNSMLWTETANVSVAQGNVFGAGNGLSLTSKLGYGFQLNHGKFLLTPYVDVQDTAMYGKTVMIGTQLKQLVTGSRTMNMSMFFNASDDSVDQIAPKLGVEARIKF